MNININKDTKETRNWKEIMREAGLVNTMQTWWPNINHKIVTWGKKSWIDHIYMSNTLIREGGLCKAGIETGHTFYKSDHNMIGAELNWTRILGRITTLTDIYKPRKRIVKAGITENKAQYMKIAETRAQVQNQKGGDISKRAANLLLEATQIGRNGNSNEKKTLQKKMDALMTHTIKELLVIEDSMTQDNNNKTSNKYRGGKGKRHQWSDVFGRKNGISYLLESMIKCCTQKKKRKHVGNLIQTIKKRSTDISADIHMEMEELPQVDEQDTEYESKWRSYEAKTRTILRKYRKELHLRARTKWRMNMKSLNTKEKNRERINRK